MTAPVTKEDIQDHPWLASWNKVEDDVKLDIMRTRIMELDDLIGTSSVILVVIGILFIGMIIMMMFSGGGSVEDVGKISGLIKQFTGK